MIEYTNRLYNTTGGILYCVHSSQPSIKLSPLRLWSPCPGWTRENLAFNIYGNGRQLYDYGLGRELVSLDFYDNWMGIIVTRMILSFLNTKKKSISQIGFLSKSIGHRTQNGIGMTHIDKSWCWVAASVEDLEEGIRVSCRTYVYFY